MYILARLIGNNNHDELSLPDTLKEFSLLRGGRDYLMVSNNVGDYSNPENAYRIRYLSKKIRSFAAQNGYYVSMVVQVHNPIINGNFVHSV